MFDHDHSAARGKMTARKLIVFKHETALGNAPTQKLFDLVKIKRSGDEKIPARAYVDYKVEIDKSNVPKGVQLEEKI
jgi:CRISPR-associated protein Csd2